MLVEICVQTGSELEPQSISVTQRAAQLDETVRQRGLAVVNVRDDGEVPDPLHWKSSGVQRGHQRDVETGVCSLFKSRPRARPKSTLTRDDPRTVLSGL